MFGAASRGPPNGGVSRGGADARAILALQAPCVASFVAVGVAEQRLELLSAIEYAMDGHDGGCGADGKGDRHAPGVALDAQVWANVVAFGAALGKFDKDRQSATMPPTKLSARFTPL